MQMLSPAAQHNTQAMALGMLRPQFSRSATISSNSHPSLVSPPSANRISTRFFNLNPQHLRSSLGFHARFPCCPAANPGNPPPPNSGPSENDLVRSSGLDAKLLRLKDTVQIFFAVLFWMSLFFWACVWDDKNTGNPTKGSRFRQ